MITVTPGILKSEKLTALRVRLTEYRKHKCSVDEREAGCPVCNDIEQIEWEIECLQIE